MSDNMTLLQTISDRLRSIPDKSIFAEAIRNGVDSDPEGVMVMIVDQASDNRPALNKIIGRPLLLVVIDYVRLKKSL